VNVEWLQFEAFGVVIVMWYVEEAQHRGGDEE
jgi:hypothetical protein